MSHTHKIIKSAQDNKVLISIWIAVAGFVALELLLTRDQSLTQPFVDAAQDARIDSMQSHLNEIKADVKTLLLRNRITKEISHVESR